MSLYAELKTWQGGLAGIVGFVALISGAWVNFSLNRKRDRTLRQEEALSVAVALYGEVLLMREQVAIVARVVAMKHANNLDFEPQFAEDYKLRDPVIYPALASKLGILPPHLILQITRFHQNFQEAKEGLRLIVNSPGRTPYSSLTVLEPAVAAILNIRQALKDIELLAKIPASSDPDVGLADAIVESQNT